MGRLDSIVIFCRDQYVAGPFWAAVFGLAPIDEDAVKLADRTLAEDESVYLLDPAQGRSWCRRGLGQPRVERLDDARLHRGRRVPVDGAHRAHAVSRPGRSARGRMAHQLVDHPSRDALIFQPGREGVAEVVGAAQVQAEQVALLPRPSDGTQVGVPQAVVGRVW